MISTGLFIIKYRRNRNSYNKSQTINVKSDNVILALQRVLQMFPNCKILEVKEQVITSDFTKILIDLNLEE